MRERQCQLKTVKGLIDVKDFLSMVAATEELVIPHCFHRWVVYPYCDTLKTLRYFSLQEVTEDIALILSTDIFLSSCLFIHLAKLSKGYGVWSGRILPHV